MILVIAGHPLTNIKDFAKTVSNRINMNHVDIDDEKLLKNVGLYQNPIENTIYDGVVLAHKFVEKVIKIYIYEPKEQILAKMVEEKNLDLEEAEKKYDEIEKEKKSWANKFFGIDIKNLEIYDLIISTDKIDLDATIGVIEKYINKVNK
jgi:cytidylate kinase